MEAADEEEDESDLEDDEHDEAQALAHGAEEEDRHPRRSTPHQPLRLSFDALLGGRPFVELERYPHGEVVDRVSGARWFFHAHRSGEHGHFHVFLARRAGDGFRPVLPASRSCPRRFRRVVHLVAVTIDRFGRPTRLFVTNRWASRGSWHAAAEMLAMLDRVDFRHARPAGLATSAWLADVLRQFRPELVELFERRDRVLAARRRRSPRRDPTLARDLEIVASIRLPA